MEVEVPEIPDSDSILTSTKKMVGVPKEHKEFDLDIVMHINSVFSTLHQIGLGHADGFIVDDEKARWSVFLGGRRDVEFVKSYMYTKVRLLFDPPTTSFAIESLNKTALEYEWRINVAAESITTSYGNVYVFETEDEDFPADAPTGALGWHPDSGKVWRKN